MRNRDKWQPSKFVYRNGRLTASRDPREVGVGSRLICDIVAEYYDKYVKEHARGRLVDLGCGTVPLYGVYGKYVTESICVDWKNTPHKSSFLDCECDLTSGLPFRDGEFDTVIVSDVLEHVSNPALLWSEMSRVLARGGKILLSVPFYYGLHEQPHDYFRYTEYALRRFAESEGLRVIVLKSIAGAPEVLADILAKNLLRLPRLGGYLAIVVQYLTYRFVRTSLGKAISEGTSPEFPLEYFLIAEKAG